MRERKKIKREWVSDRTKRGEGKIIEYKTEILKDRNKFSII